MYCFKPVIKKSSSYMLIMHTALPQAIFLKIHGSDDNWMKALFFKKFEKWEYHCLYDCFNPYKLFLLFFIIEIIYIENLRISCI